MKRTFFVSILALLAVVGCESDHSSPAAPTNFEINLFLSDATVVAPAGVEVTLPITAQVTSGDGAPAPGIRVAFRLLTGSGHFTPASVLTDNQGVAASALQTTLVRGDQNLSIAASTVSATVHQEVLFKGTGQPASILINEPLAPVLAPANAPVKVNLLAQMTDTDGSAIGGVPLKYILYSSRGVVYGRLAGDSVSRADGSIEFSFESLGGFGKEQIVVSTDTLVWKGAFVSDTAAIEVKRLASQINSLTVRANPENLDLGIDVLDYSTITAQVKDIDNVGLPNVFIEFRLDGGGILSDVTPTDSTGKATAQFCDNYDIGVFTVTVTIPGTPFEATCTIRERYQPIFHAQLSLSADRDFIYADNGLTVANLTAVLKYDDDQAMVGKEVTFHAARGAIVPSALTDSLGIARAVFTDLGLPSLDEHGNVVPVVIYAKYRPNNLVDSVDVAIRPRNAVVSITMNVDKLSTEVSETDSISFRVTCFLQSGAFVPPETLYWEVSRYSNITRQWSTFSEYRLAELKLPIGIVSGLLRVRASVLPSESNPDTISAEGLVHILPGPISRIRLAITPYDPDTPSDFWWVTATVTDTFENPVREGELIHFSTDKGNISPSTLVTDTLGQARAILSAGGESGVAVITVWVTLPGGGVIAATSTFTFVAGFPNSIELTADPIFLNVAGCACSHPSTLRAIVKDETGHRVERATTVVFQILNNPPQPLGCNLNNRGSIDSARTANGVAVVSLNAGEHIGGVLLRAYTWRDPDSSTAGDDGHPRTDTISVINSSVAVVAGPPFQCDLDVNAQGEDAGGGVWQVAVSARVWDVHRNPVADRIPVVFTVDPEIATIDPGFTGNDIGAGATPGIAYTRLRYSSINTYEPITISSEIQAPDGLITANRRWVLPLQRGRIELSADPGNWMFDREHPGDTCQFRVWALVTDGHGVEINGAPVLFTSSAARFYWLNEAGSPVPFFPEASRRLTGSANGAQPGERGIATVFLRGIMNDFFLDDFALEATWQIAARVEGADGVETQPINIWVTRH